MKSKAVSGIMLTLLLMGMLTLALDVQPLVAEIESGDFEYIYIDILNVTASPSRVYVGDIVEILVVYNLTYFIFWPERFASLIVFYDHTDIDGTIFILQGSGSYITNRTYTWDTTNVEPGTYVVSAESHSAYANDTFVDGTVFVTILGDVDGDGDIDSNDLFDLSKAYGSDSSKLNWNSYCDLNRDDKVDDLDLSDLSKNYGKTV